MLCCSKQQKSQQKRPVSSTATTRGPQRTSISAQRTLCRHFLTRIPALSSGPELWIAIHNHRPEPLRLHSGQNIGVLELMTIANTPSSASQPGPVRQPPMTEHLSSLQQQQLNDLFKEFSDVFSQGEDDLGYTPLLEHTIETHGPPLRQPYRRQNPAVRREEMAQVQQMLASDVIRPSNSPWAWLVVMVKKKDGILWFCVDFRQLNAATVKDAHPLPRIDDLLDELHWARWFSTLDLKIGYWQVPILEQDKKTAFRTSSGQLYEFNQVPFGLCNAPSTFSRLMDCVLSGLHWETCLFYLDDIIVFSSPGRSISLGSDKSLSDSGTLTSSWGPRSALLLQKRSVTLVTGSRKRASCQTRRSSLLFGKSRLPKQPPKSALSLVSPVTTGDL